MRDLSLQDCSQLRQYLNEENQVSEALERSLGEARVASGIWRFFSAHYPVGGVSIWNSASPWKQYWDLQPTQFHALGEDIFGNQLIIRPGSEDVFIWNHENGEVEDLLLAPAILFEAVVQNGLDWIGFYNDGSLKIAESKLPDVPPGCHLHWTTPLILGGQVSEENTSVIDRTLHLVGHAELWKQLRGFDPGTIIIPNKQVPPF